MMIDCHNNIFFERAYFDQIYIDNQQMATFGESNSHVGTALAPSAIILQSSCSYFVYWSEISLNATERCIQGY